jgi:hypothetical protein
MVPRCWLSLTTCYITHLPVRLYGQQRQLDLTSTSTSPSIQVLIIVYAVLESRASRYRIGSKEFAAFAARHAWLSMG